MGQQEAVVQHIERLKKRRVNLHLTQKPKTLLICHVQQKNYEGPEPKSIFCYKQKLVWMFQDMHL